jgi:hypothetical protein
MPNGRSSSSTSASCSSTVAVSAAWTVFLWATRRDRVLAAASHAIESDVGMPPMGAMAGSAEEG